MAVRESFNKPFLLVFIFFISALLFSIALLFTSLYYYRLFNKTKLDPIGQASLEKLFYSSNFSYSSNYIALIGDSRARSWPTPSSLNSHSFINLGVSGHTTSQVLIRFQSLVSSRFRPNIIVFQAGINDLKTIPLFPNNKDEIIANCQDNISELVALALQSGAFVVLTTILPVGDIPLHRRLLWSNEISTAIDLCNQTIRSLRSDRVFILETAPILSNNKVRVLPMYQLNSLHINTDGYRVLNHHLVPLLDRITLNLSISP
jgi:hypothetical protein